MRIPRALYFLFFAAAASLMPFLTLYYQGLGLTGRQIGLLAGMAPFITLVSASVWGAMADSTNRHRLFFLLAIGGTWVAVFMLSGARNFLSFVPIVAMQAFFIAPVVPLMDNGVMALLGARKNEYGQQRVWGTYGWGITAAVAGVMIQRTGLQWAFTSYLVMFTLFFLVATRLPMQRVSVGGHFRRDARRLLGNHRWLLFLGVSLTSGISLGIFLNYLFLYLEDMGASNTVMGLSLTVATLSEIPVFLYSRRLLERWGTQRLLAFSLLATAVRAFAYVYMGAPWQVLLISLLHGPAFATLWTAGVAYADEIAPDGLGATAQGMFGGMVNGLGAAIGGISGGFLYESFGAATLFRLAGWATLAAFLLFVGANWHAFYPQWPGPLAWATMKKRLKHPSGR